MKPEQDSTEPDLPRILRLLMAECGLNQKRLALRAGLNATAVRDILQGRSRSPRLETLLKLSQALDVPRGALTGEIPLQAALGMAGKETETAAFSAVASVLAPQAAGFPVFASARGGEAEMILHYDPIEYIPPPPPLAHVPGAFAIYVIGESMQPAYAPGDLLLIHPTRPPQPGEDVLVILRNRDDQPDHGAMVKRLERIEPDRIRLRQFNPEQAFGIKRNYVAHLRSIIGCYKSWA